LDRIPPAFFKQGLSANVRLLIFAGLSLVLLVLDARSTLFVSLRQGVATVLYPLQRVLLMPRDFAQAASQTGLEALQGARDLRAELDELRRIETANARTLLLAEQLAAENAELRRLLGAREQVVIPSVVAEVLYQTRDPFARRFVLDKGIQHGLAAGQPVVDAGGVIGQITRVFPLSSELTLVTDRNLSVPVQIDRTGARAIAYGDTEPGRLELRYVAANADVREGDAVSTSGLDGLYPQGLPVGRVILIDRAGGSTFARILVEPAGGVDRSRLALVLQPDAARLPPPLAPPPDPPPRRRQGRS
jgi:rod shape-determining protein MreC